MKTRCEKCKEHWKKSEKAFLWLLYRDLHITFFQFSITTQRAPRRQAKRAVLFEIEKKREWKLFDERTGWAYCKNARIALRNRPGKYRQSSREKTRPSREKFRSSHTNFLSRGSLNLDLHEKFRFQVIFTWIKRLERFLGHHVYPMFSREICKSRCGQKCTEPRHRLWVHKHSLSTHYWYSTDT